MSKFEYLNDYVWKYKDEYYTVQYSFINDLSTDETLSSCTASIWNSSGVDKTASMLGVPSVSTPVVVFSVTKGSVGETYEIKVVGISSGDLRYIHKIILEIFDSINLNTKIGDSAANSYVTLPEANSYIRNVLGHPNKWDTLSIEGRKRLLIEACRDLNRFNFLGVKYYDNQNLEFPRDDHDVITGNCGTPITTTSFKHANFTSDTYGSYKSNTNYWKYGTVHITSATPVGDTRNISANNITTDVVTLGSTLSGTPTTNTQFIAFEPIDNRIKNAQCQQAIFIIESNGSDTLQNYKESGVNFVKIGDTEVRFIEGAGSKQNISPKAKRLLSPWIRKEKRLLRA